MKTFGMVVHFAGLFGILAVTIMLTLDESEQIRRLMRLSLEQIYAINAFIAGSYILLGAGVVIAQTGVLR